LCGEEAAGLVKFPFDRIVERVQPSDAQRAGVEDLKNAAAKAADTLKSSCPTEMALTPVGRLDIAERRFQAMRDAAPAEGRAGRGPNWHRFGTSRCRRRRSSAAAFWH